MAEGHYLDPENLPKSLKILREANKCREYFQRYQKKLRSENAAALSDMEREMMEMWKRLFFHCSRQLEKIGAPPLSIEDLEGENS
ncbi:MAG: hypothetical protein AAFY22_01280 [Pseudomonadota bacterium]